MESPSPNGSIGRTTSGQFAAGNAGGPGNPHVAQVSRLRSALLAAVTEDDVKAIVVKLIEMAKTGSLPAAKLLLDRTVGKFADQVSLPRKARPLAFAPGDTTDVESFKRDLIARAMQLKAMLAAESAKESPE